MNMELQVMLSLESDSSSIKPDKPLLLLILDFLSAINPWVKGIFVLTKIIMRVEAYISNIMSDIFPIY